MANMMALSVDTANKDGITALMDAAARGRLHVVKQLVESLGASCTIKDKTGQTALDKAKAAGHADVVAYLQPKTITAAQVEEKAKENKAAAALRRMSDGEYEELLTEITSYGLPASRTRMGWVYRMISGVAVGNDMRSSTMRFITEKLATSDVNLRRTRARSQWWEDTELKKKKQKLVEWVAHEDPATGRIYYENTSTGVTTWLCPPEFKDQAPIWISHLDPATGCTYYSNTRTGEVTWDLPDENERRESVEKMEPETRPASLSLARGRANSGTVTAISSVARAKAAAAAAEAVAKQSSKKSEEEPRKAAKTQAPTEAPSASAQANKARPPPVPSSIQMMKQEKERKEKEREEKEKKEKETADKEPKSNGKAEKEKNSRGRHHSRSRGISVVPRPPTLPKGKDLKQWLSEQTASDHYLDADLLLKPPKDDNLLEDDEAELEHDQRLAQEEKELLAAFANSEKDDDREIDARYPLPPEPQREIDGIEDIPFDDVLEKQQVMTAFRSFLQAKIRANPNQYKQCKDDWEFLDAVQRWRRTAFAGSSGKFDTGKLLGEKLYMTYLDTSNKNKPPIITITDKMKWRILARLGKLGDGKQEEDEDEPPPPPPPDDDDAPPGPPDSDDSPAESSDEESYAPPPPRGAYKAQGPSKYTPTPNNKSTTSQTLPEHEIRTLAREGVTQETFTEVTQMVWNRFVKTISKEFLASPEYKKLNDGQRRVGDDKYKALYDEWKYKYEYMLDKRTRMKAERAEARRVANEARERRRKQIRAERAAIKEARSERERLAAEEAKRKREKEEEAQRMAALAEKRKKQKEFVEKLKEEAAREARHESSSEDEDRWLELQDFDGSDDEKKKKKKKEKKAPPPEKRGSAMLTGAQISGPVITSPPRAGLIPIVKRSSGIIVSRDSNASDTPRTKHSVSGGERDDEDGDDEAEEDDDDDDEDMDDYDTEDDDDDEADDDPEVQAEKAKRRAKKEQLAALEGGADMDAMTKLKALGALGANLVKAKLAGMKAVEDDTNNGMFTRKRDDAMDDDTTISSPRGKIDIDDDDRPDPNFQVPKGESRFNIKTMAGPHGMSKPQGWYNYKKWKCVCFELKQFRGKLSGDVNTIYCHVNVDSQEFKTKAETSKVWNEHMEFYLLDTTQWIEVTVYRSDGVILGFAMIPIVDVTKRSADDAPMWVNLLPPPMDQLSKAPVRSVNIELELHFWLSKKYPKDHGYKQVRHIETEERSAVADKIRMLVSKKKKRFKQDGFDLDLSYITPSVIAMGYPSTGHEGIYRNPLKDVQRFFLKRHSQAYKLYNLCSERQYSADKFEQSVGCYPFDDHNPPPFELIAKFCEDVRTWLSDHPQNVVAIHCKAGKGRTGTVIACYLVYARVCPNAQAALDYFAARRTKNKKGVTIPSQMRYVHYFEMWCNIKIHGGLAPGPTTLFLTSITLSGLPTNCRSEQLFFTMMMIPENSGRVKYNSFGKIIPNVEQGFDRGLPYEHITFDLHRKLFALSEDFHFAFFKKTNAGKAKLFAFWLNSRWETLHAFDFKGIASDHFHLILYKKELDKAIKDKKHRTFTADFRIQLTFQATPVATYIKQKELVDVVKQIKQESGGAEVSIASAASTTVNSTPSKSNLTSSSPSSNHTTASARPSPMALGKAADGSKPVQTLIPIKALPGRNDLVKIGGLPTASKFVVNTGNGVK